MPHLNLVNYRVEIGKLVHLMAFPKGKKGTETVILSKPQSSVLQASGGIPLPHGKGQFESRLLLAVAMGEKVPMGNVPSPGALLGFGLTMNVHDPEGLKEVRKAGIPWTLPCMFDGSSIISDFVPASEVGDTSSLEVYLEVDGDQRSSLTTRDLVMDVPSAVRAVSQTMSLFPGDIIGIEVMGTSAPIGPGSRFEAGISSVAVIRGTFKGTP